MYLELRVRNFLRAVGLGWFFLAGWSGVDVGLFAFFLKLFINLRGLLLSYCRLKEKEIKS